MTSEGASPAWAGIAAWVGLILHLVVGVFPYSSTGLLAPPWAYIVLYGVWLVLLIVAIRLVRHRSPWTLAVPVVALAFWFGFLTLGELVLGWTA